MTAHEIALNIPSALAHAADRIACLNGPCKLTASQAVTEAWMQLPERPAGREREVVYSASTRIKGHPCFTVAWV